MSLASSVERREIEALSNGGVLLSRCSGHRSAPGDVEAMSAAWTLPRRAADTQGVMPRWELGL
jgi:hypothetical protein